MKYLTLSAILISMATLSCKKENLTGLKQATFNESFSAQSKEKVLIKSDNSALTVEVLSIIDNRCSYHTEPCDDEGICTARLKVTNTDNSWTETILTLGNNTNEQSDEISIVLDNKTYLIDLNGVSPKPSQKVEGLKSAEILVKKNTDQTEL